MTIAVQISAPDPVHGYRHQFNYQCFTRLAILQPGDHFIFISDAGTNGFTSLAPNVTPVTMPPVIRNSLLMHYWYQLKLPRLLNKYNADVFISGGYACSLRSIAKQYIRLTANFLLSKPSRYEKKYLPSFTGTAANVIVENDYLQKLVSQRYRLSEEKISEVMHGHDRLPKPMSYPEKEKIQEKLSGGAFFYAADLSGASIESVISILKAYSLFKKWQHSAMPLLLLATPAATGAIQQTLKTYKYRNDTRIIISEKEKQDAVAAAYVLIVVQDSPEITLNVLDALHAGTALLITAHPYIESSLGNAASYTGRNEQSIADAMMQLYKQEDRRTQMIQHGKHLSENLHWNKVAARLATIIASNEQP